MSGPNNATIAYPGINWRFLWPTDFDEFQLDIVGFLAVLGEGSIQTVAQVSGLSRLFYLPRLLPAPQALLRTTRPNTLEPINAAVSAIHSGNFKDHLHHVAHILLDYDLPAFTVRCVRISKKADNKKKGSTPSKVDWLLRGVSRQDTIDAAGNSSPSIKARANGPLLYVTLLDFGLSLFLFIISFALGDTMSLIATLLLSFLSTLIGVGNKWTLKLQKVPGSTDKKDDSKTAGPPLSRGTPDDDIEKNAGAHSDEEVAQDTGDEAQEKAKDEPDEEKDTNENGVVIRYPKGSYMVVRCNETVARELFFAPEEIEYTLKSATGYRLISLVGTLMLMLGVIFLANAKLQLQICWGGAFIVLNAAHWLVAAVPARWHWDLQCYDVHEEGMKGGHKSKNFTEAMWKAILLAHGSGWVRVGKHAAPQTLVWDAWLAEANKQAKDVPFIKDEDLPDPLAPDELGVKGRVWQVPAWKAKPAYDALKKQDDDGKLPLPAGQSHYRSFG